MAACPVCGMTDWHPPHTDLVDETPEVKSSALLDEWEQVQSDLRAKMIEAGDLVRQATKIRTSLASRGITVTSDLGLDMDPSELPGDEEGGDVEEIALTPVPDRRRTAAAVQEVVAAPSKVLKGRVIPKRRQPTEDRPIVLGDVKTAGVEHSQERAAQDEQREDDLREQQREAQSRGAAIVFQRPTDVDTPASQEVAEIRRAAGEDVPADGDALSGFIANQMAAAAQSNGIR